MRKSKRRGHGSKKWLVIVLVLLVLLGAAGAGIVYIRDTYTIQNIYVEGNVHYSNDEIIAMVTKGRFGNNSLYLSLKYKDKGIDNIPFIETMTVSILSPDTIKIIVYEKALAGYVEYLGTYLYFDKEGVVVEASDKRTEGIPQVTGLVFSYVVMYEPLPVERKDIFDTILDTTQLLNKYELTVDRIYFDSDYNITLYFDDVKVAVGAGENMDDKMILLKSIMGNLEGKSGTLRLENYTADTKNVTFEPDVTAETSDESQEEDMQDEGTQEGSQTP